MTHFQINFSHLSFPPQISFFFHLVRLETRNPNMKKIVIKLYLGRSKLRFSRKKFKKSKKKNF